MDQGNKDDIGQTRTTRKGPIRRPHKIRFRPPQGVAGYEPEFFEGPGGSRNSDRGVGSDQYSDTGSPASINLASEKEVTRPKPGGDGVRSKNPYSIQRPRSEGGILGDKMERDPMEEKQVVNSPGAGGWQEFNDMQQR